MKNLALSNDELRNSGRVGSHGEACRERIGEEHRNEQLQQQAAD